MIFLMLKNFDPDIEPGALDGVRRAWEWFILQAALTFQIPLFGGIALAATFFVLLARLILKQQILDYPDEKDRFLARDTSAKPKPTPLLPTQQLPPLRASRKRALSPVPPLVQDSEHPPRGPLRFGNTTTQPLPHIRPQQGDGGN
jgi:hypothetical protein